jgi:predicted Zn-dependent peptidase
MSAASASQGVGAAAAPAPGVIVPVSSPHDPRAYRHLTLPNALQVLLVNEKPKSAAQRQREAAAATAGSRKQKADESDGGSDSKPAVVALSVAVGSWSDPAAIPGLAHFCEHMLFMGPPPYKHHACPV